MPSTRQHAPRSLIAAGGRRLLRLSALLALSAVGAQATAAVVYTYTGKPFQSVAGTFTTSDRMLFSFTLAQPLPASQIGATVSPLSWQLSVGAWSMNSAMPGASLGAHQASTDALGGIYAACFNAFVPAVGSFDLQVGSVGDLIPLTTCSNFNEESREVVVTPFASGNSKLNPGTWTMTTVGDGNPVPTPGSLALVGMALLAVGLQRRVARSA